ncbi:MAG TPA: hypothetical protein VHV32_19310 [Candidatus Angelobacter sp.]|jgi:hypothetical protein|nr:hypothetical protein [Candidatus Angelobacter sp.]
MQRLINWLKRLLGITDLEAKVRDLERHFVTKRGDNGEVLETLADVPLDKRKERAMKPRGMSLAQRKAWLEETDGGRIA